MTADRRDDKRPRALGDGACVLVIDDSEPVRRMVTEALVADGFAVLETASADEARVRSDLARRRGVAVKTDTP